MKCLVRWFIIKVLQGTLLTAPSRGAKEKQYAETERRRLSGRDGRKYEYRRNRTMNNALVRKDLLYDPHNG
jgi:hypothetical protein